VVVILVSAAARNPTALRLHAASPCDARIASQFPELHNGGDRGRSVSPSARHSFDLTARIHGAFTSSSLV
jgi:hypothetical protein